MRRRAFITLLASTLSAWPLVARAQQAGKVARIGFLGTASASGYANEVEAFRQGLRELGYIEGKEIVIDYRWADGNYDRLAELATQLVRSNVDLIVAHGTPGSRAAKQATATVPIVLAVVGDPVQAGIVASFARPGGNITGQSFFAPELFAKRIELLRECIPHLTKAGALVNPDNTATMGPSLRAAEAAARSLKVEIQSFQVRGPNEFAAAFESMEKGQLQAVLISDDAVIRASGGQIAASAAIRRLPSVGNKEFAQAGGLLGYGVDQVETFRRAALFVDRILKGANPADIPIEQATKFELIVNLKTAKTLGITLPPTLLARADEVIE